MGLRGERSLWVLVALMALLLAAEVLCVLLHIGQWK